METDPAGEDSGVNENDFEPVGNVCGASDRDRSRCCLRQLDGVRSHTNAHARAYRNAGTHSNTHAGTYRYTGTHTNTHAGANRYTDTQSTERIGRDGASRNTGGHPTTGCRGGGGSQDAGSRLLGGAQRIRT